MNFVKKTSSVTRGRGMIELQRAKRFLPMPAYAETKCTIYSFTDILFKTSETFARHFDRHKWKGITQTQ